MSTNAVQQSERKDAARPQPLKFKSPSGLLRKFTTKLKPPTLLPKSANSAITSPSTSPNQPPTNRRTVVPPAPQDSAAIKRRQAALRQCGLIPATRKDLSELEEELDRMFSHVVTVPQDQPEQGELSTAEKIRREWQGRNETQPGKQSGSDVDPKDTNGVTSDSVCPATPVSLYSIPGAFLFPDIPEEDAEIEKKLPLIPPTGTVDPLGIPLPDSPRCSSLNLSELPPTPSSRENKRPPPIITNHTTIDAKENAADATNSHSGHSLKTKSSLPALSPTMTTSSSSSISTPRDDESRERMEAMITPSSSGKSWSSRYGKVSDTGRASEDQGVVHETIPESPEPTPTESKTWGPNRESTTTMGSAGFEAFVEKREKRLLPAVFQSNKGNSSSSSRKSTSSELSFGWYDIANDFSLKPLDGGNSRSSTSLSTPIPTDENKRPTPTQSRAAAEKALAKITRSKTVIAGLGLKISRKMAPRPTMPALPSPPPSPVRIPTVKIEQNRGYLIQNVECIEDEESRRLTRAAFMDF